MSVLVENSSDRSGHMQTQEVSKTDVLTKEASVAVGEEPRTPSPNTAEGDLSAGSKSEDDTVYVNGHPVIENGMIATVFKEKKMICC